MALKVHLQHIWPQPENDRMIGPGMARTYDAQAELLRDIFGADTKLQIVHNERSSYFSSCSSMDAYNIVGMLDGLAQAETGKCDVALIACGNDPALAQARDLLPMPVVSITEAAMLTACQLGQRFGVITMDDGSVSIVERNLRLYGLEDRAVRVRPVRSPGFHETAIEWHTDGDYLREKVIPRFEDVARTLIADGADVIVTACGNYSAFATHGYNMISGTRVPVVEALSAGAYMAKALGEQYRRFGIGTSKHAAYAGLPPEYRAMGLASARGEAPSQAAEAAE